MSSAKSALNPKRASGEALNPKRASATGVPKATSAAAAAAKPAAGAAAAAAPVKKKVADSTTSSVTKGVAGLKVGGDSPPAPSRRVGVAAGRRRGDDDAKETPAAASAAAPAAASASSSSAASASKGDALSAAKANQARRRLSITAGQKDQDASKLDGADNGEASKDPLTKVLSSLANKGGNAAPAQAAAASAAAPASAAPAAAAASSSSAAPAISPVTGKPKRRTFSHYSSLSKVGYVPFNPNKVNQDRSIEIVKFGNNDEKAFFGCFDGHGALGHEVSSFLIQELPKFFLKQPNLDSNPHEAITKAFIDCNVKLASSSIDCTFSGSTGIVVYIAYGKIYSCNAGDSRAVLARATPTAGTGESKLTAIALSSDQKPEREDEKKRILENKGRVEACKGMKGEDIGPPRVWLSHQDVPGLAMSRSFGDLIAASVGVIARPEIWERDQADGDKFMILASDGVWEFISNQEAVDLVHSVGTKSGPEEAVKALVEEATKRWHAEEEVVDDITAVVVYF